MEIPKYHKILCFDNMNKKYKEFITRQIKKKIIKKKKTKIRA